MGATSAGCPGRFSGADCPKDATRSGGIVAGMSGVQIGPGATQLTRMPRSASSCPRLAVRFAIAALVAEYGTSCAGALSLVTELVFRIEAPAFRWGSAAFVR
jgi:hypothetical protein